MKEKTKINTKATFVLLIAGLVWIAFNSGKDGGGQKLTTVQMPSDEAEFVTIVSQAQEAIKSSTNDMQVGGVKARRDADLCKLITDTSINGWLGKVEDIGANSDGKGVISLELADGITLKTWNNSFSDGRDNTLIESGTDVFEAASSLKNGDIVRFSGDFIADKSSCLREASLSLRGKISSPEFIFRFRNITKA
ncbi:TPA: hypothetical protein MYK25_000819 [Klebsiella pneumoniae]|nr:hypothetical protein [Klebsiella pneumoniae]